MTLAIRAGLLTLLVAAVATSCGNGNADEETAGDAGARAGSVKAAPGEGDAQAQPAPGEPAAAEAPDVDFDLPLLEGGRVQLSALRGKTVVLDFWATWCAPCVFQIPILNEVYQGYRDRGVEVIGVSVDTGGAEAVRQFTKNQDLEFQYPVALAGDEQIARDFGVRGFPSLVIVAPDGSFDASRFTPGLHEKEQITGALDEVLARHADEAPAS